MPKMSEELDVIFARADVSGVGMEIAACLESKGFCVINPGLSEADLAQAVSDVDAADGAGKLTRPAEMVVEGLLGAEGSARIMELAIPESDPQQPVTGLRKLDEAMTETARVMDQFMADSLGFSCPWRTPGLVHETGMVSEEPRELTMDEASLWMTTFMRQKLMLLFCLGPMKGTLELRPFDEDAEVFEVATEPGSLIVLRADAMSHRHFANSRALVLSCYLMEHRPLTKHSQALQECSMAPAAQELQNWTVEKMKEIKEQEYEYNEVSDNLPLSWSTAMNSLFHCQQRVAVRGMAGRYPSTFHQPTWFRVQMCGPDYAIEIPLGRWNVYEYYDADPECWRWGKSSLKHGCFMDGAELFDNRFFGLSPAEAGGMDIHQREVLEVGYDALWAAGYKKGKLMNSLGGVYLGSSMTIFGSVSQVSGATGGAASINSNRFSFCLGLKGPSLTLDTESSASLSAVYVGCEGVLDRGRGVKNAYSLSGGVSFQLGTIWWPQLQSAGLLNTAGRVMTFDEAANGYCMGDGCGFVVLKRLTEMVEGEQLYIEDNAPLNGVIAASTMNSNGANSAINAPNGPSEQELVADAVKHAGLIGQNVDAVEVNGQGAFMADAVEVDSLMRVLRGVDADAPLGLGAVKSRCGHATECAGVMSLQKAIMSNAWNLQVPNCHLRTLNPHIEPESKANHLTESLEYERVSSYTGVTSRGFGGTNVHVLTFGECDPCRLLPLPDPDDKRSCIAYWPGGGGELETDVEPRRGYFIAGTWNGFKPVSMDGESGGSFGYTVTLGAHRFEEFQIYLDGDSQRALHPAVPKAYKGAAVQGPDYARKGLNWRIAGTAGAPLEQQKAIRDTPNGALATPDSGLKIVAVTGAGDAGQAGDQYRVRLKVHGKYRGVTWEKVGHTDSVPASSYFVTSNWNGWGFDKMVQDGESSYSVEALLLRSGAEFQIARNADAGQVICPSEPRSDAASPGYGPDDGVAARGMTWLIGGQVGEVYKITVVLEADRLEANVSWVKLREEQLTAEQDSISKRARFGVVGSWGAWVRQSQLTFGGVTSVSVPGALSPSWTSTLYYFFVQIGPGGQESFQLLQDLDWDRVIHPSSLVQASGAPHSVALSPNDGYTVGLVWTIGQGDVAIPGDVFVVKVSAVKDRVTGVSWAKAQPSWELDGAIANNEILKC
uniref:Type I polyketide synthase n=1 Tax=Gambierdiscus excentricus TaxID=986170 RepID=A0A1S6K823_9DINO|nr:type I polyketide synthase [Gambierdiscus excentricus]